MQVPHDHKLIDSLLGIDVQDYIRSHENDNVQKLLLKHKTILGIPTAVIADQIAARRKARYKLPEYYRTPGIVYPPAVNLEQCSSEATARFKATLLFDYDGMGAKGADLTGGFGVDTFYMSQQVGHLDYIEPDAELCDIAKHSHMLLGAQRITHECNSCDAFLSKSREGYDFLYLDPSRRSGSVKTFRLTDASPDVVGLVPVLLEKSHMILIKASPLLDVTMGLRELKNVSSLVVVAVENECKELLFIVEKGSNEAVIRCVDLDRSGTPLNSISFTIREEKEAKADFSEPLTYLYEPGTAILKAGAFKWIAEKYGLKKLAPDTHLYTADEVLKGFPGRIFRNVASVKIDKKLKKAVPGGQINIIARNHPLSVDEIKKKTALKEGGEQYLLCARTLRQTIALVSERIQ